MAGDIRPLLAQLRRSIAGKRPDLPRVYGARDKAGRWCVRITVGALTRDLEPDQARKLAGELLAHADLAEDPCAHERVCP